MALFVRRGTEAAGFAQRGLTYPEDDAPSSHRLTFADWFTETPDHQLRPRCSESGITENLGNVFVTNFSWSRTLPNLRCLNCAGNALLPPAFISICASLSTSNTCVPATKVAVAPSSIVAWQTPSTRTAESSSATSWSFTRPLRVDHAPCKDIGVVIGRRLIPSAPTGIIQLVLLLTLCFTQSCVTNVRQAGLARDAPE